MVSAIKEHELFTPMKKRLVPLLFLLMPTTKEIYVCYLLHKMTLVFRPDAIEQ